MKLQRVLAATLAIVMALGSVPALAQQIGTIAGKATDEAKQPYSDYAVQLRDVSTGQVVNTLPLNVEGKFSFASVAIARTYLVELVQIKERKIICTEGPYSLTTAAVSKVDVNISCGKVPVAIWLLAAGAGAAAAVAIATRSSSR
jgi:hypothetical protein